MPKKHLDEKTYKTRFEIEFELVEKENAELKASLKKAQEDIAVLNGRLALAKTETARLDWLDAHAAFVADEPFRIGPYKIGELRKMADDGIRQSEAL